MYLCFSVMNDAHIEKHIFDSDRDDIEMSPCFSSLSNILTTPFELLSCSPQSKAHTYIESANVLHAREKHI